MMKLNICVLSLLVSQILAGHEPKPEFGNYPDICTNRTAGVLKLTPAECDPTGREGLDIQVVSTLYPAGKYSHMVIGHLGMKGKSGKKGKKVKEPKKAKKGGKGSMPVVVYLPGTTDWPALSSCLLESVSKTGYPVIGLNHAYLRRGDSFRNARCESLSSLEEQVFCLEQQHIDAIYGGDYGSKNFSIFLYITKMENNDARESPLTFLRIMSRLINNYLEDIITFLGLTHAIYFLLS